MFPKVFCPVCTTELDGPFPLAGCHCGFNISGFAGLGTSAFQQRKDPEHRDLLFGRDLKLYGKPMNTSFDYYGDANLIQIVDYALTYGAKKSITSLHGNHSTEIIISYIPNVIGSGIIKTQSQQVYSCSGICLMSPESIDGHEHSFAFLEDWIAGRFPGEVQKCSFCPNSVPLGIGICAQCMQKNGNNWLNFVDPNFKLTL